jgi:glycosyltransferase involved in cell wall biosynthesis
MSIEQPTTSIVIPTFNRARMVPKAIESALKQTVKSEVILCDHGSTDDTPAVAARYGDRIRYIRRDVDRGPIACWRDGIEQASGELVHITYDDDWIDDDFVARTQSALRDDVAFVYTRTQIHAPDGTPTEVLLHHPAGRQPVGRIVQHLLRSELTISPGCALFRKRDALKNLLTEVPGAAGVYGRNSGVGEDLLLFLLTTLDYSYYVHLPEALSHFLAHPASITTNAGNSGKMQALVSAYQVAKQHYLRQPGSIPLTTGLRGWIAKRRWKMAGHRAAA